MAPPTPDSPQMLHWHSRQFKRPLLKRMRLVPWSKMQLYLRLLLRLALLKVTLVHLELLTEDRLLQTWHLRRWIPWLMCFGDWTQKTFKSMRSRAYWPISILRSILRVVWALFLLHLLMILSCLFSMFFFCICWFGFSFHAYLMYLESIFILYIMLIFLLIVWFPMFIIQLLCYFCDKNGDNSILNSLK